VIEKKRMAVLRAHQRLQRRFALLARVAAVRVHHSTGVAGVDQRVEMLAVVLAGRARLDLADQLVLDVHVRRQFVAEVTLAVFLRPARIGVALTRPRGCPVRALALLQRGLVVLVDVLTKGPHHACPVRPKDRRGDPVWNVAAGQQRDQDKGRCACSSCSSMRLATESIVPSER
jgi:hypothetical protein